MPADETTRDTLRTVADTMAPERPLADGPWGRVTLVLQLVLFAVPASIAWSSTINTTAYLPLVALPTTFIAGVVMLALRGWRRTGARVIAATCVAFVLEVGMILMLIVSYSSQHPGWDLS